MALLTERYFHCPEWPACQCADGTLSEKCPGRTLSASSGDGGPARASDQASPALRAIDPDEAVTDFRAAMTARRSRRISGETLIADINALLDRGDRAISELAAIQAELAMHRRDLGELFGLPVDPGAAAGKTG
ncbi:MAG: hypothetical protein CMF72_22725 [Mameliella sp.]|nr:hypothetical protein [Mameliella sp.]